MYQESAGGKPIEFSYGKNPSLRGIIDNQDKDLLQSTSWGKSNGYVQATGGFHKPRLMHRIILERMIGRKLKRFEFTDHINRNRGDNRRKNLRLATNSQNQANRGKPNDNTSGYKGVSFDISAAKRGCKACWKASIRFKGKLINCGDYNTPEAAARAYNKKAKQLYGEYAVLNQIYITRKE